LLPPGCPHAGECAQAEQGDEGTTAAVSEQGWRNLARHTGVDGAEKTIAAALILPEPPPPLADGPQPAAEAMPVGRTVGMMEAGSRSTEAYRAARRMALYDQPSQRLPLLSAGVQDTPTTTSALTEPTAGQWQGEQDPPTATASGSPPTVTSSVVDTAGRSSLDPTGLGPAKTTGEVAGFAPPAPPRVVEPLISPGRRHEVNVSISNEPVTYTVAQPMLGEAGGSGAGQIGAGLSAHGGLTGDATVLSRKSTARRGTTKATQRLVIRNRQEVVAYSTLIVAALQEALDYDPARHHNQPLPALWIEDPNYLQVIRALIAELKRLNELCKQIAHAAVNPSALL